MVERPPFGFRPIFKGELLVSGRVPALFVAPPRPPLFFFLILDSRPAACSVDGDGYVNKKGSNLREEWHVGDDLEGSVPSPPNSLILNYQGRIWRMSRFRQGESRKP